MKTAVTYRIPRTPTRSEILDDPYIPPPIKPPIESKRDKFERIWKASILQNKLIITNNFRYSWNFIQSKGTY